MADNTAMDAVVNTPELLESILVLLDTKTLLLSQRVSRTFKATIDCSQRLQRELFFKPASARQWHADGPSYNPLLLYRTIELCTHGSFVHLTLAASGPYRISYDVRALAYPRSEFVGGSWQRMLLQQTQLERITARIPEQLYSDVIEIQHRTTMGDIVKDILQDA